MKLHVLIVDEDRANAVSLQAALQSRPGTKATLAEPRMDALLASARDVDLILLDPMNPHFEASRLFTKLIEMDLHPGVILLSSFYSNDMIKEFGELGVAHCMYKPVDFDSLMRYITRWQQGGDRLGHSSAQLQRKIASVLTEMGMPPISGFEFCQAGVTWLLLHTDNQRRITKELYPYLTELFHQTPGTIERNIRYAIECTWKRGNPMVMEQYLGCSRNTRSRRPTNTTFLRQIALYCSASDSLVDNDDIDIDVSGDISDLDLFPSDELPLAADSGRQK